MSLKKPITISINTCKHHRGLRIVQSTFTFNKLSRPTECRRIDAFELWCWRRLLRVPWTAKETQPVHPKGNQSWIFIGRTDVEAETPILWPPDVKNWLIGKDPDVGKDRGWEEKGMTEDEMVRWHHQLDGHEFGWTPGVGDGQGGLACCSPWGRRVGHDWVTELNWWIKISFKNWLIDV